MAVDKIMKEMESSGGYSVEQFTQLREAIETSHDAMRRKIIELVSPRSLHRMCTHLCVSTYVHSFETFY